MPMQLPTDTQHVRLETRQYELFNRPLGQGISRRKLAIGTVTTIVWSSLMLIVGLDPISRFGPVLYIVPIFLFTWKGTQKDESGRMQILQWYDWLLARMPSRRKVITNPLISLGDYQPQIIDITVTAELHPRQPGAPLTPVAGRRRQAPGGAA